VDERDVSVAPRRYHWPARIAAALLALCGSCAARAQVLERDADGVARRIGGGWTSAPGPEGVPPKGVLNGDAAMVPAAYRSAIEAAAARYGLSPAFLDAVARAESGYDPDAVSPAGAIGVMQLMPATARDLGVDPRDPGQNILGGAAYLRRLLDRFDGDIDRTLAAYNAGPGAVDRHAGVPPYRETRAYVAANLDRLAGRSLAMSDTDSIALFQGQEP
jgi:soluble lytic murein transglycosylase-like protein